MGNAEYMGGRGTGKDDDKGRLFDDRALPLRAAALLCTCFAAAATACRSGIHRRTCQGHSGKQARLRCFSPCSWSSAVQTAYNSRGDTAKTSAANAASSAPAAGARHAAWCREEGDPESHSHQHCHRVHQSRNTLRLEKRTKINRKSKKKYEA